MTEGARDVSHVKVTGKISVTNTNALPVTADLADSFGGAGWSCTVNGGTTTVAVPASKTTDYSYSCTGPDTLPANGTNTATVGWSKSSYPQAQADVGAGGSYSTSAQAAVTFTEHATNKTVTLSDDKFSGAPTSGPTLPASLTWQSQGHQTTVLYSRTVSSNAGTCTTDTNTAKIKDGPTTLGTASATAKLCAGADLVVTKNAVGSITRSYLWKIDKRPCGPAILRAVCDLTTPKFTVGEDGAITLAAGNSALLTACPAEPAGDLCPLIPVSPVDFSGTPTIVIADVPILELPEAGGTTPLPYHLGGGLLLVIAGVTTALTLVRRRRAGAV